MQSTSHNPAKGGKAADKGGKAGKATPGPAEGGKAADKASGPAEGSKAAEGVQGAEGGKARIGKTACIVVDPNRAALVVFVVHELLPGVVDDVAQPFIV